MQTAAHTHTDPLLPASLIPTGGDIAVIARQPIVDAKRGVIGYELLHRRHPGADSVTEVMTAASDAALMFNALSNIGSDALFGSKLAFINCTTETLSGVHLEIVDPERIVLEVPAIDDNLPGQIAATIEALDQLKMRGFRLAFGAYVLTKPYAAWVRLASFIKLDIRKLRSETLPAAVRIAGNHAHAQVIAEKRASFSCLASIERPVNVTPIAGLFLAGDYTACDYPATLEAAVRSGVRSALHVMDARANACHYASGNSK